WPGLSALVLGPAVGGFITTYASWRWIFFLNLPLGLLACVLTLLWVENARSDERPAFDWLTFALAGFASTGVLYAMEKLGAGAARWQIPAGILALSLLSGVLAVVIARRRPESSFIDIESLRMKTYAIGVYGASAFRIPISVLPFLLPLMFQLAFGLSAFHSGLYLLALFGGDLSMKAFVIQVLRRFGFRRILLVNGVITAASVALLATFGPSTPAAVIVAILFFHGACRSMQFTCLTTLSYAEIPPERMSRANGFLSTVMQLCLGMGVAVGAVILRVVAHLHGHSAAVPQVRDFRVAILLVAGVVLVSTLDALGLPPHAGAATSGHMEPQVEVSAA
ncbi:MAG TPA: MFS transporter, partial [Acidisarcina sp.]